MINDQERLRDILNAVERIERYRGKGREEFEANELIQTWMIHHLQIIGEAAGKLTREFRSSRPEVPWKLITGMRNILVHDYLNIDLETVWSTIDRDIPELKRKILELLVEPGE